jgi:hypothetical protein
MASLRCALSSAVLRSSWGRERRKDLHELALWEGHGCLGRLPVVRASAAASVLLPAAGTPQTTSGRAPGRRSLRSGRIGPYVLSKVAVLAPLVLAMSVIMLVVLRRGGGRVRRASGAGRQRDDRAPRATRRVVSRRAGSRSHRTSCRPPVRFGARLTGPRRGPSKVHARPPHGLLTHPSCAHAASYVPGRG